MAELWAVGTLGVESVGVGEGVVEVWAYFAGPVVVAVPDGVVVAGEEVVEETDWLARYRAAAVPFPVGAGLFVDPREPEEEAVEVPVGRRGLRIPARGAFGIGSHESTGLAVEVLEEIEIAGMRVLDVGTGTGILSFVALMRGARSAVGYDVDVAAPVHARDNARLNGLGPLLFAGRAAALRPGVLFDLALINVIPEEVYPELPAVTALLGGQGEVVFSGILAERGDEVLSRMAALGFGEVSRRTAGEWIAFRLSRQGGRA